MNLKLKRTKIAEGIFLNIIETEKFKTNYMSVNYSSSLSEESASMNALFPAVLMRGTEKYPDMASLNRRLDFLYDGDVDTRIFKKGERQFFGFSFSFLDNSLALDNTDIFGGMMEICEQLLFRPLISENSFNDEYVESEKKILKDVIDSQINNKSYYALSRCREIMCENERFSVSELGDKGNIDKIGSKALFARYKSVIESYPAEIFYIGRTYGGKVEEKIASLFSRSAEKVTEIAETEVIKSVKSVREVEEKMSVTQGKLSLGFRTGRIISDENYPAFSMLSEVLGNTPNGKLFMNVREKMSLCYYCQFIPESIKGILIISSGINFEDKEKAQSEILRQLDEIRKGNISDSEMDAAHKSVVNAYRELPDSPASLENWYINRIASGSDITPDENIKKLLEVTKEQISDAAKDITLDTVYFLNGGKQ